MSFSKLQEIISPDLNRQVVKEFIRKHAGLTDIRIDNLNLSDDTGTKGDSYLSKVCKFTLKGVGKSENGEEKDFFIPVFAKYVPTNVARRKTFRSLEFFTNEINFYAKVWPELDAFQKSKNSKVFDNIAPFLSASHGDRGYIALEDLSYKNYKCLPRTKGLDYEETVIVLRFFARFHSLSLAFKDQYPEKFAKIVDNLSETYFAEKNREWYRTFQKQLIECVEDAITKELPDYVEKFRNMVSGDYYGRICAVCKGNTKFSGITHGDTWIPNLLIKYDSDGKTALDTILIDFQLARYASILNDVTFFLLYCADESILSERWNDFLKEYYDALIEYLQQLGTGKDKYPYADYLAEVRSGSILGAAMTMENMVMALKDESDVPDLDAMTGEDGIAFEEIMNPGKYDDPEKTKKIAFIFKCILDNYNN